MISKFRTFFILFFFLSAVPAFANNLVISNVSLEDRNQSAHTMVVQFNISWDHSWRKNDGRHDAAWVFVKLFQNSTAPWIHGKLYTAGTNPTDSSPGTNSDVKIVVPSDKIGAFIERTATGNGTFESQKVRLNVDLSASGIANSDTIQVKVFGIEMVYIPEGPFYIGDGNGTDESTAAFHQSGVDNTSVQITTTGKVIKVDNTSIFDDATLTTTGVTVTGLAGINGNTSWPNGYAAFYLMKYELSQVQYVDFLNTLSRTQQKTRTYSDVSGNTITNYYVMAFATTTKYRQGIRAPASGNGASPTTVVFGNDFNGNGTFNENDDGQNIAMNYINWPDLAAYADWSGLRPYTELEYEKAARGPASAVYLEYAWGSTKITIASSILNSGKSTEVPGNLGEGLSVEQNNGAVQGPLRSGFAAASATNRKSSGAGYYGNMDLSDNLQELTVSLGLANGRSFAGTHGDGILTTTASYEGNATNNDWPGINATTARGVTGMTGTGLKGGTWYGVFGNAMEVSDRFYAAYSNIVRDSGWGIRCARTAP